MLQIQGLALLATFLSVATGYALLSLRRHTALLIANGIALAANIVLTLVLVPIDQARGAAIAAVIAESCLALGQLILLLREGILKVRIRPLVGITIAGLAGAAPLLVGGLAPILRTLAGLAIYAAVIGAFGLLPPELAHALQDRRRR